MDHRTDIITHVIHGFSTYSMSILLNLYFEDHPDGKKIKEGIVKEYERHIFGNKLLLEAHTEDDLTVYEEAMEAALAEIRESLQI